MALKRKTRISGSSIVVTIPSQIVKEYDFKIGDEVEIVPLENGEMMIKKLLRENV